ncbi:MAG TPA: hypothetical protein VF545_10255 [Thermoleophilaceae bacterium]
MILLLVVLGIKSCRDSARKDSFRNFVRDVGALVQASDTESKNLFAVLAKPGAQGQVQLQNAVNGYASDAQQLVDRAKGTDRPDELSDAKRYFVETLELRRDGLDTIARELRTAVSGRGSRTAVSRIASQMQLFLASDVVYSQRVLPNLTHPLKKEGLLDQVEVPKSHFIPDLQWIRPSVVVARLGGIGAGGGGPVAPGLHGMSLIGVTAKPGGQSLAEGGATSITVTPKLSFDVTVQDAGDNDERDVVVQLSITGAGKPIVREQTLSSIGAGEQKVVTIPLAASPSTGRPVSIRVDIKAVPGEKKLDNNKATYPAIFTR